MFVLSINACIYILSFSSGHVLAAHSFGLRRINSLSSFSLSCSVLSVLSWVFFYLWMDSLIIFWPHTQWYNGATWGLVLLRNDKPGFQNFEKLRYQILKGSAPLGVALTQPTSVLPLQLYLQYVFSFFQPVTFSAGNPVISTPLAFENL